MTQIPPIADDLFVQAPTVRLVGGRSKSTGRLVFPLPADEGYEPVELGARGTLWSYTVQRFRPKSPPYAGPEVFEPFALGYVELPGEMIVETRITGIPFDQLTIGMPMVAVIEPFHVAATGETRGIYAFTAEGSQA